MRVGVLALQGDFAEHARLLVTLGADVALVRTPMDLSGCASLVLPGGESTTQRILMDRNNLVEPLTAFIRAGAPTLATCAGLILLAAEIEGEEPAIPILDIAVARNAFGRQQQSFEAELASGEGDPYHAVFIRAPAITRVGPSVKVLARLSDGSSAAVRQGNVIGLTFHPELAGETRFHAALLAAAS